MWQAKCRENICAHLARTLAKTAIACVIVVGAMIATAWACPQDNDAPQIVATQQNAPTLMTGATVSVGSAQSVGEIGSVDQGLCSTGCHCKTVGCCCFASFASLNAVSSGQFSPSTSTRLSPLDEADAASAGPPPDFRPPRTLI